MAYFEMRDWRERDWDPREVPIWAHGCVCLIKKEKEKCMLGPVSTSTNLFECYIWKKETSILYEIIQCVFVTNINVIYNSLG